VQIITDKTNDVTLIIYDNTAASGTVLFKAQVTGADDDKFYDLNDVRCNTGMYADVTGTGAEYIVYHR